MLNAEHAESAEKKKHKKKQKLDGDYMDYEITWIQAHVSFSIHVIN